MLYLFSVGNKGQVWTFILVSPEVTALITIPHICVKLLFS